ncbi:peptidoglycan recognition protein family protein [Fructobacillus cardui]|uniref:peptidoglycan recognition protein family protein n=1 Tax=Fructobacillus cardui TaxID=2893170 RepID=UPI00200ADB73|nr:peptidoglycan recognition family protein [Fructobacillus cardui]MCK8627739.1 N-acetylmuramoyl-L-alanine amidase [Fructobacillus cardui]
MTVSGLATPYEFQDFPHYTEGRSASINKIVIHHMATTDADSVPGIWKNREASAHYGITQDGSIRAYVDENNTAWHAGQWGANSSSIGIEHANTTGAPDWGIAQATIDSSAKLVADIAQRYGFGQVVPYKNLFPHSEFYGTACPGQLKGKLQEIADKANDIMAGGNGNVATQDNGGSASAPKVDNRSAAIKEFQDKWKNRWALRGNFRIRTCEKQYDMFQVLTDDLNVEPNSWFYNGIPTGLLEDVSDPQGRSFEDGAIVRLKDYVNYGTIDAYDINTNSIGILFTGYPDMIWFDADKFLAHP